MSNGRLNLSYMTERRWLDLMHCLGFGENLVFLNDLFLAYEEKHRRYHTCKHIDATLAHLNSVHSLLEKPAEVELALWLHDVIYAPFSSTNEQDSADLAEQFLLVNHATSDVIDNVKSLIIATEHSRSIDNSDQAWLVDIDLSILGASADVFKQFESDVRFEYKRVPYFLYKSKRREVLQGFLDRKTIYQNSFFIDKFEAQARRNLSSSIEAL